MYEVPYIKFQTRKYLRKDFGIAVLPYNIATPQYRARHENASFDYIESINRSNESNSRHAPDDIMTHDT